MATKEQPIFQLTFIKKPSNRRPQTSLVNRSLGNAPSLQKKYNENDPIMKMKYLKAQAKKAEKQYIQMLTSVKQSQKCINQNYKEAQIKKVSFLKLYQTKKLKNLSSNLIDQCQTERQKRNQQSRDQAKRIKIEQEIKHLIVKQEKQTHLEKLKKQIHQEKEKFQNIKFLKTKQLYNTSRNSFLMIKQSHENNSQRKRHIRSVSDVRSKHNYWKRVSEEIMILEGYEKVIKDLQNCDGFNLQMNQIRAQTSQTARSLSKGGFFITQKK